MIHLLRVLFSYPAFLEVNTCRASMCQNVASDRLYGREHRHRARIGHALVHQHYRHVQILHKNDEIVMRIRICGQYQCYKTINDKTKQKGK